MHLPIIIAWASIPVEIILVKRLKKAIGLNRPSFYNFFLWIHLFVTEVAKGRVWLIFCTIGILSSEWYIFQLFQIKRSESDSAYSEPTPHGMRVEGIVAPYSNGEKVDDNYFKFTVWCHALIHRTFSLSSQL